MTVVVDIVDSVALQTDVFSASINNLWMLLASFLVFFMQPGFALLEAGQVRAKNAANVTMKNMMDWSVGILSYFLLGFGVAVMVGTLTSTGSLYPGDAFSYINDSSTWIVWLFGAVFAMTAATIVSGAVAGRMNFGSYVVFAFVIASFIYPVVQGFTWQGGLLSAEGYIGAALGVGYLDFAGATVVHMLGGVAGLTAAYVLGPRKDRFDEYGDVTNIPGHSVIYTMLGTFILAFGWYGFNVGTQSVVLSADGVFEGAALGRVAVVTTLGMTSGAVASAAVTTYIGGRPNPTFTANGLLAGLVAITGAAIHVTWWGGILIGAIGGALAYPVYYIVLTRFKVDDVCGVFSVHGAAGAVGTILIPIFAASPGGSWQFLGLTQLVMQILGVSLIAAWAVLTTFVTLRVITLKRDIRVSEEAEEQGLDQSEHNMSSYPEFWQSR